MGILGIIGVLIFFGCGAYQLLLGIGFFNGQWGLLGVIVFLLFPPLTAFAPFVIWAVGGVFPTTYFVAWVVGWLGLALTQVGKKTAA